MRFPPFEEFALLLYQVFHISPLSLLPLDTPTDIE